MRHNEELIQIGIAMFKKACSDAVLTKGQPNIWSGRSCAGGGAYIQHKMNEDAMTPANVARELDLKNMLKKARAAYDEKLLLLAKEYVGIKERPITARDHFLSMTDSTNWPEGVGPEYAEAMKMVHEGVMDFWDELESTILPESSKQ